MVVFGFPLERKGEAEEFFTSLGESTVAESNAEIINAFRIGYKKPTDALRAMRKNGEVLQGNWMIGVKWAVGLKQGLLPNFVLMMAPAECSRGGEVARSRSRTRRVACATALAARWRERRRTNGRG